LLPRTPFLIAAIIAASLCAVPRLPAQPIDIGNRLELFVDRHIIDKLDGLEVRLHRPRRAGAALRLDRPWEGQLSGYFTVIHDEGRYKMYYRGRPLTRARDAEPEAKEVTCYAESTDGKTWFRPTIGLFEIDKSRRNNVIMADAGPTTHNFAPFIDTRPGVPESQRYKAVGGTRRTGLIAFVSADGIRWKKLREEPIITEGAFDSQNNIFWSEHEQRYVCFFRTFKNGVRWITRTTSKDFLHWEPPTDMSFGDAPHEHLYTNQTEPYFRAPHIYIGTAARFMKGRWALTPELEKKMDLDDPDNYPQLGGNISDAVLLSSRGGTSYQRTFLESLVRAGAELQDWVARSNYPARGVVPTGKREMSFYVQRHYGQPSTYIERLALRTDGFASLHAPYRGGEMLTKPLRFTGKDLVINYETSAAGGIRIEVQDESGKPLPGFALDDCRELIGDQIERVVTWRDGTDLSKLAGRTVRLRIVMKDADLYSLRFR
jgi:hypothetical protein